MSLTRFVFAANRGTVAAGLQINSAANESHETLHKMRVTIQTRPLHNFLLPYLLPSPFSTGLGFPHKVLLPDRFWPIEL